MADGAGGGTADGGATFTSQLGALAVRALPAIAGAVGFVGFVAVLGAAIDWVRFSTAGLPADQAVRAIARPELVTTGAVSLIGFTLLGALAVLVARLIDPHVQATSGLLRGAAVVAFVELVVVLRFVHAGLLLVAIVLTGFVALWWFANESIRTIDDSRKARGRARRRRDRLEDALGRLDDAEAALRVMSSGIPHSMAVTCERARTTALCDLQAILPDAKDRLVARARAELWEESDAGEATLRWWPSSDSARFARWVMIVAIVAAIFVVLGNPAYHWGGVMLAFVLVLNAAVFGVARANSRFVWYGIALFASIPLFGAALGAERTYHTPKLQPVALIRKSSDRAICGIYIAETDKRVYVARVTPKAGGSERAEPGTGHIIWIPTSDVDMISIGQAQTIHEAVARAPLLARELYADRAEYPGVTLKPTTTSTTRAWSVSGRTITRVTQSERPGRIVPPRRKSVPAPPASGCTDGRARGDGG